MFAGAAGWRRAEDDASGGVEEDVKKCRREESANNLQLSSMRKVQVE
jgi:hypothetical protein